MTGCVKLICLLTAYLTFLLISETPSIQAQEAEGSIRLRRGINSQSGYLEVFHDGGWGRVCDTQWDHIDAHVVCKQEGYNGAKFPPDPFQQTPNTARPIILDNVQCAGGERALTQCEKGPWGSSVDGCQTVKIQCLSYLQQYIGCFMDDFERILPSYSANCNSGQIDGRCNGCDNTNNACDSPAMTVEICVEICCTNNNYVYAGLQAGEECFCGDITADYARYSKLSEVHCNTQCSGNPQQSCGSDFIMDVYDCSSGCGIPEGVMGRTNLIIEPQVQQATLYKTGEELSFSCQTGFLLLGAEKISCQPGGPWSAIVPECVDQTATVPVMNPCPVPEVPQNGQYIPVLLTYQSGSNIQLFCNSGFELEGTATRTCQRHGTWTTAAHLCKGVAKCPSPTTPSNGQMAPVKVNYDPGESVLFTCSVGYLVQGASTVICKDDNTWSDFVPTCQRVDCGPLPNYPRTTPSTSETTYQTLVTFECIDRYQFVNGQTSPSKICEKDGRWVGGDPVCELRECRPLPEYFKTVRSTEETAVDTFVTFNCQPGYQLTETIHPPYKLCTRDDVWIGENPVCVSSGCPPIRYIVENALPSTTATDIGTLVTFTCMEGKVQLAPGYPTMNCSQAKQWVGTDPNCVDDFDCGPLNYTNAVASTNLTTLGTVVNVTCPTGLELEAPTALTCTQQGWVGFYPKCRSAKPKPYFYCGGAPYFPNAIPYREDDLHEVSTTFRYNCSEHYEHEGDEQPYKTCIGGPAWWDSRWAGPDPNCQVAECEPYDVPYGWTSIETVYPVDKAYVFHCTINQKPGKAYMFCKTNGSWLFITPSCDVMGQNSGNPVGPVCWALKLLTSLLSITSILRQ